MNEYAGVTLSSHDGNIIETNLLDSAYEGVCGNTNEEEKDVLVRTRCL